MMEEELGRMAPDLGAIEEWRAKDAAYAQRLRDLEAATAQRNQARAHACVHEHCARAVQDPLGHAGSPWVAREHVVSPPRKASMHPNLGC